MPIISGGNGAFLPIALPSSHKTVPKTATECMSRCTVSTRRRECSASPEPAQRLFGDDTESRI